MIAADGLVLPRILAMLTFTTSIYAHCGRMQRERLSPRKPLQNVEHRGGVAPGEQSGC
jgi:hypothetical protein